MKIIRIPQLFLLPLILAAYSAAMEPVSTEMLPYKDVPGSSPLVIKHYRPANDSAESPRPAIVFFFGGGWTSGDLSHLAPQAEHLAARGMSALCVQYRTKKSHDVDPQVCLEDAWDAMRFVHENAADLNIDPTRIAAGGGSAGGHLAAATAFCPAPSAFHEDCRPSALVLFNPVIDNGPGGYGHNRVSNYWQSFSPLHNIGDSPPPTLFLIGDSDKLIPIETAHAFANKMNQKETRCDLQIFETGQHGFFNKGRPSPNGKSYFQDCIQSMDTFLVQLGYLN